MAASGLGLEKPLGSRVDHFSLHLHKWAEKMVHSPCIGPPFLAVKLSSQSRRAMVGQEL